VAGKATKVVIVYGLAGLKMSATDKGEAVVPAMEIYQ